jgi:hypothetical protein
MQKFVFRTTNMKHMVPVPSTDDQKNHDEMNAKVFELQSSQATDFTEMVNAIIEHMPKEAVEKYGKDVIYDVTLNLTTGCQPAHLDNYNTDGMGACIINYYLPFLPKKDPDVNAKSALVMFGRRDEDDNIVAMYHRHIKCGDVYGFYGPLRNDFVHAIYVLDNANPKTGKFLSVEEAGYQKSRLTLTVRIGEPIKDELQRYNEVVNLEASLLAKQEDNAMKTQKKPLRKHTSNGSDDDEEEVVEIPKPTHFVTSDKVPLKSKKSKRKIQELDPVSTKLLKPEPKVGGKTSLKQDRLPVAHNKAAGRECLPIQNGWEMQEFQPKMGPPSALFNLYRVANHFAPSLQFEANTWYTSNCLLKLGLYAVGMGKVADGSTKAIGFGYYNGDYVVIFLDTLVARAGNFESGTVANAPANRIFPEFSANHWRFRRCV